MSATAIGRSLLSPLQLAPLLLITISSVLLAAAFKVGLFGIPLALILGSWFLKYSFALLDRVTIGDNAAPVLSIDMLLPGEERRSLVVLVLLTAVLFLSGAAAYSSGWRIAILLGLLCLAILPAMLLIQGATGGVAKSLSPLAWWACVRGLRGGYALLLLFFALFLAVDFLLVVAVRGGQLYSALGIAGALYSWLALQSLMGRMLFERGDELQLEAFKPSMEIIERDEQAVAAARQRLLDEVYAATRARKREQAWQLLIAGTGQADAPAAELLWMYQRIATWPDARFVTRATQELVSRLLVLRRTGEALRIVKQRLADDPAFRPRASAELLQLAALARDAGDPPLARMLLQDFAIHYPQDAAQARASHGVGAEPPT